MNLTIRYAVPADTPTLQTLGKSSYYHHFKELWDCPVELRQFIDSEYAPDQLENSLNDQSVTWLIAESDKPVGFAKISWDRPVSGGNHSGALLNKLYFAPGETGKGYGRILFEKAIEIARHKEQHFFWLQVLKGNDSGRRFYESLGMQHLADEEFTTPKQKSVLHVFGKCI
ncbi:MULTISPECIES: GNAT family N-acetyltransferase [unclassified Citrobacter]|uniref:GNAT family N-acetyltransferase n=1 Tax=unclassified Citrobacter TaxID=2644389 RepID=UPI0025751EE4|nr:MULTISPECIES: GNAT family N-acetyltransferase [unclassified Citrobacter]MDM2993692.1 GNAT family N-acetyltransferase [Citrobacter sp. CK195]MDM3131391.1 GNAT family N-acetyltransferase [Citrobacter sp. CK205]